MYNYCITECSALTLRYIYLTAHTGAPNYITLLTNTSDNTHLRCGWFHLFFYTKDTNQCIHYCAFAVTLYTINLSDAFVSNSNPKYLKLFTTWKLLPPQIKVPLLSSLLPLKITTYVFPTLTFSPSLSQKAWKWLYSYYSTVSLSAKIITSSANSKHHTYILNNYTIPEIYLPRLFSFMHVSTYYYILSKNKPNSNGLQGQPCFTPINISIYLSRVILQPLTSAFKSTYKSFNALTRFSSSWSYSKSTLHNS